MATVAACRHREARVQQPVLEPVLMVLDPTNRPAANQLRQGHQAEQHRCMAPMADFSAFSYSMLSAADLAERLKRVSWFRFLVWSLMQYFELRVEVVHATVTHH